MKWGSNNSMMSKKLSWNGPIQGLPNAPRRPHSSLNAGNSMTLDKQAIHKAQFPTLPLPAAQCPWQGATCLLPSLGKYSRDNAVNIAQTNASLDFSGGHCCCYCCCGCCWNPFSKCLGNAVLKGLRKFPTFDPCSMTFHILNQKSEDIHPHFLCFW